MPHDKAFGRRSSIRPRNSAPRAMATPISAPMPVPPQTVVSATDDAPAIDVDAEVEAWNRQRKATKRSFREPWRTLAIVSTVGFGFSTWLLPDSVASVADTLTLGLCGASFYAGLRTRRQASEHDTT